MLTKTHLLFKHATTIIRYENILFTIEIITFIIIKYKNNTLLKQYVHLGISFLARRVNKIIFIIIKEHNYILLNILHARRAFAVLVNSAQCQRDIYIY